MTALPPPPLPPPTRPGPAASGGRPPWPPPKPSGRRSGLPLLVAVVAVLASGVGTFIGIQVADDSDGPPQSASAEDVQVGNAREQTGDSLEVANVADQVGPSVVTINAVVGGGGRTDTILEGVSVGTGMIVTSDGEILTNAHVVEGASEIRVRLAGETEPREASLLASDSSNDLALLRIDANELQPVTFADPESVYVGDDVVAVGFALGLDGAPSVTTGIVSATDRTIMVPDGNALAGMIQTDAAISSGNSGGPLVNTVGEVVGVNTAVYRNDTTTAATNVGLAISAGEALRVIEQLREQTDGEERPNGYLGVQLSDRRDGGQGALIVTVENGTPADEAGLVADDIVVGVGDETIDGSAGLIAAIRGREPGDVVSLEVRRDSDVETIEVELTERPDTED